MLIQLATRFLFSYELKQKRSSDLYPIGLRLQLEICKCGRSRRDYLKKERAQYSEEANNKNLLTVKKKNEKIRETLIPSTLLSKLITVRFTF